MRTPTRCGLLLAAAWLAGTGRASAQCPVNVPHTDGTWRTLAYPTPINPISATLLHTGKVFLVAGSENDAYNNSSGAESYRAALWDPTGTDSSSFVTKSLGYDVFCSGTAQLPHGRTLTIGGSSTYSFTGEKRATFFDPATEKFVQSQSMGDGRWYGTATTLGDGRVMAFSGLNSAGGTNTSAQIYDLKTAGAGWGSTITQSQFSPPLFPHMFQLPNGKVFFTGHGTSSIASAWIFNPSDSSWTASAAKTRDRDYGSAVILPLLPPSYTPKVMNFGGGSTGGETTEVIDLSAGSPSWTSRASMSAKRVQMNAVLLPNGKILAEGGSAGSETPDTAGKTADIYDPSTNTMTGGGTAAFSRLYHSTAILLPDATVVSLGSNPGPRGKYVTAIEIYTPPYLYDANDRLITTDRPVITGVPSSIINYASSFSVSYQSASPISSAVLIRPGSATHAFDMEQRLIGLCGPSPQPACTGSGTLNLTAPPNGNIAPPGFYMLFLLDSSGVPSKAQFVELGSFIAAPPSGTISAPSGDVTITAGDHISFSSTTTATKYSWIFPGGTPATSTSKNPGNVTFSTAGEYIASLTVLDAADNSDPSPPMRKIKVLPSSADFDIAVTPDSRIVSPGQSATFTVTVTPLSGFASTVSLTADSEGGFPTGVSAGGFSPSTIPGSGSSTLTMNTASSTVPYTTSVSVHGTAGSKTHTASTTLVVNLSPPGSLAATTSNSTVNLTWNASNGATSYRVLRSLGGAFQTLACTSSLGYSDTGLTNGTTYHYAVAAVFTGGADGGGASSESAEILATPPCPSPTYSGAIVASKSGTQNATWTWGSGGASTFDLVRGDLGTLRATGGDFHAALDALPAGENACLANDTTALSLVDPYGAPPPDTGVFTLLRPVTTSCVAEGTLDDGAPSEVASRDAEVAASSRACP
jgi:hypothetical protein